MTISGDSLYLASNLGECEVFCTKISDNRS